MTDKEFEELIHRYQTGSCSAAEKKQLEMWLDSLEKKKGRFEDWGQEQKIQVGKNIMTSLQKQIKIVKTSTRLLSTFSLLKVAASIIILIGCCLGIYTFLGESKMNTSTLYHENSSTTGTDKYILSDGTIVWLKGKSKLYYPSSFGEDKREVRLVGEALFEVTKDPFHPFIIQCDSLFTKVVGTSFNIKSNPDVNEVEVIVFTGKVSLSNPSGTENMILQPYQKARYKTNTQKLSKSVEDKIEGYLEGTQYNMLFEDTPIQEVIRRIEQKFDVKVKVENERSTRCVLSADLTDQSLVTSLKLITQSLGGNFQQQGKLITLNVSDCQ
jgi:ferric-dicitrate binding protein FerR (iron transport regulator)